ncbi:MAG: thiamine pyrophosphate-dependent enzyme [Bryobacteraceae bacterium]
MGKLTSEALVGTVSADRDQDFLLECLKKMIQIRTMEQYSTDLSQTVPPKIHGSIHLCAGQEAVPVGAVAGLRDDDQLIATYRGHGWALASGLSTIEVFGEIAQRSIGINGGRGGSAYMMAPWTRFIGENSIVGAGVPIGCGVALANQVSRNGRVVIVSIGDGAFNQGATHEGLAFAAARNLPLLVICENNGWSELTPTSETFKVERISQRASGYGMPGLTINGTNPVAVRDTIRQAAERARRGEGPTLIECRVPRLWGHYNRDIEHYRSKEDRKSAADRDPIVLLSNSLIESGVIDRTGVDDLLAHAKSEMEAIVTAVFDSPLPDPATARSHVWAARSVEPVSPSALSEPRTMSFIQAVNEALGRELETRPEVLVYGEDIGNAGGIFGASRGLQKTYGAQRVFDTPISESAILGSAVGAALAGMKPIVEIMWADFMLVALDQLINQAANIRYITGGRSGVPMVVRTQQGGTPGSCAQHSQCLEALLAHIPGLRIALPSTPQDAYDILRAAVADPDPCIVFEARGLYQSSGPVRVSDTPQPIGKADLKRPGTDAVIITWGTMVRHAMEAAETLGNEGLSVGVLDLRWLSPLDENAMRQAAMNAKGRVIVAHEANLTGGFGAEITARLYEMFPDSVPLRVRRVATADLRIPASPVLAQHVVPNAKTVQAAVRELLAPGISAG